MHQLGGLGTRSPGKICKLYAPQDHLEVVLRGSTTHPMPLALLKGIGKAVKGSEIGLL